MSSPQPLLATHRITVFYTSFTLTHSMHLYVNASPTGAGNAPYVLHQRAGISDQEWKACLDNFIDAVLPIYPTGATFDSATLFEFDGTVYQPRESTTIGEAGSSGAAGAAANQFTLFGRSTDFDQWRMVFLDTANGALDHGGAGALGGASGALVSEIENNAADHTGAWLRSKSATFLQSLTSYTVSYNRKSRRRLGLV